jgi:hypothetical protein
MDGIEKPLPPLGRADSAALGRRRRGRNIAMLIALVAIAGLLYAIAIVKLAHPDLGSP